MGEPGKNPLQEFSGFREGEETGCDFLNEKFVPMDEPKRRQVHVFISERDVVELFIALIKEVIKDKYDFKVTVTTYDNELLEMAKHHAFDLFVLYFNNIIFPTGMRHVF